MHAILFNVCCYSSAAAKYRKVSPIEHVLLRPDSYVGSNLLTDTQDVFVYDECSRKMRKRSIRYVPALLKIFDEILVNAADNKQRDKGMKCLSVTVDRKSCKISVYNDGEGIPIEVHPDEEVYVPTLIFGTLLTSSNYDDSESKVVGGRNGFGAKLCNIFSKEFVVETGSAKLKKRFKQTWRNNMGFETPPIIEDDLQATDFTRITFVPDLNRFNLSELDDDIFEMIKKRTIDVAGTLEGVEVKFNGQKIGISGFKDYVNLYSNTCSITESDVFNNCVYCYVNPFWKVAVATTDFTFQHVSFVNNIATTKGGRHVDYIVGQIISAVKKKLNQTESKSNIRPSLIRNRLFVFINSLIENPSFDSQTKECLTTLPKNFGSKCILPESFLNEFLEKTNITQFIMGDLNKKAKEVMRAEKFIPVIVPKLEDAEKAGSKDSSSCTLIITEGDSAKALAVAGLSVIGRQNYGVLPLRGKLINVRGLTSENVMVNKEIASLVQTIGLDFNEAYNTEESLKKLRYRHVMIMTDQDADGSHIKGLLINFFYYFWPCLIKSNFLQCFLTPLVKAKRGSQILSFYNLEDFNNWRSNSNQAKSYMIKYYKGLGTSTAEEAKEYFREINRHRIQYVYGGNEDNSNVDMFFNRSRSDDRKKWISQSFQVTKKASINYEGITSVSNFIKNELIEFSQLDLKRSIPSAVDGLKPSQRKILHTMFRRFSHSEIRVSQLAGAVAQSCCYHHGETALVDTIIRLARNFVGSNNINLLEPLGQFGTRLLGGADAASSRYIYTSLSPITRAIFPEADDEILQYEEEENVFVEPKCYFPIIPLILVNGASGIATGWATKILPRSPLDIVENIRRSIDGRPLIKMMPYFRDFKGTIEEINEKKYVVSGVYTILSLQRKNSAFIEVKITELPIGVWTDNYKTEVLSALVKDGLLVDFNEFHTENTVSFLLRFDRKRFKVNEVNDALKRKLKLSECVSENSMVAFDDNSSLRLFSSVEEIFQVFFDVRKAAYEKRRQLLLEQLQSKSDYLQNQIRFVDLFINGSLKLEKKTRQEAVEMLMSNGFKRDPLTAVADKCCEVKPSDFDYLLDIPLVKLCDDEIQMLIKKQGSAQKKLNLLNDLTWKELWLKDLDNFLACYILPDTLGDNVTCHQTLAEIAHRYLKRYSDTF
uniref:DNA topoisomerase 2 n=1 Tax=Syphacia muris TaxID=451379 RepID=A0A0N5AZ18_9BILA